MPEEQQVYIHLAKEGMSFIYTVVEGDRIAEPQIVSPLPHPDDLVVDGYYGGSQVMD